MEINNKPCYNLYTYIGNAWNMFQEGIKIKKLLYGGEFKNVLFLFRRSLNV